MASSFKIDEVSALIAELLPTLPGPDPEGFVTHHQIVHGILASTTGAAAVQGARTIKPDSWSSVEEVARNMVAWFSQQITTGHSPWTEYFDRKRIGNVWAYRPVTKAPQRVPIEPQDLGAIENEPKLYLYFKRERDVKLAMAKRNAERLQDGSLRCEACGFAALSAYPGIEADICEVHHRTPLSSTIWPAETKLSDLAVLCPTCHRAIHRTKPYLFVESFKAKFFPEPVDA
jgi:hypothetical protein